MSEHLLILDCDGVLVDSEGLSSQVMRAMAGEMGLAFSAAQALDLIRGRKVAAWVAELEEMQGGPVPESFVRDFRRRTAELFTDSLSAVPGVEQALRAIDVPCCVASSAPLEKIRHTLGLTGLLARFEGSIHSAYEVGVWKPDPGLFLHAARAAQVSPENCAVVEDSVVGATAGTAAGMTVFGYAPDGSGMGPDLMKAGAIPFSSMNQLPALVRQWARREEPLRVPAG